ncbi:hypothetical protein ACM7PM_11480 [Pseudomonas aeruginosa]
MSKELNKAPVEQAGGDERAVDGKPRATKCPDCGEGDLMPGDLCACGYETDPAAGYACSECDGSGDGYVGEVCRECDGSGWFVTPEQARAALAQPSPKCATCGGTGMVDDGEITCSEGGIPYENGPVKCVKDCPDCKAQPSPPPHPAPELDFSRPLETENGDPVKWICADVIEYKSARVCVAKDTGLVYSSPYIGLKIRNVMPEQAEAERPEVVAYRTIGRHTKHQHPHYALNYYKQNAEDQAAHWRERGCEVSEDELMTVAQHERIVGALRAERDGAIKLLGQSVWQKIERLTQERDAALARVEQQERTIAGINEAHAKLAGLYEAAQAQHSAGYAEARQCVNCRHIGINDAADYAACHDCRWTGPEPDEDKCPGCAGENCMAAACPECGGRYELVAEAKISTPAAQAGQMPQAWLDVQAERRRQITAEGWTPEHDDEHNGGELADAAACYALWAGGINPGNWREFWPWAPEWLKHSEPRRMLVKAAALILAEIQRLDRAAAPGKEGA